MAKGRPNDFIPKIDLKDIEEAKGTSKQKGRKFCTCCQKELSITSFFASESPMYALDKRLPVCKDCCKNYSLNEDGSINYKKFKQLLRQIDKPLYYDHLYNAERQIYKENSYITENEIYFRGRDILGKYFTLIQIKQDRQKSFADSQRDNFMHLKANRLKSEDNLIVTRYSERFGDTLLDNRKDSSDEEIIFDAIGDFEVTEEMINLFGDGYTPTLYKKMYDKYEKLKINYTLQTNIHQEALATYVRFKVQEEIETSKGNIAGAKKWYDAAQTAAQDAKLTPKQLTKADLDNGINSISELTKAVEQATDVIKILPHFKYRPNDAPDFNIWCYVNYERQLNDQVPVTYEDVYQFYDKRKKDYIEQNGDPYGIFEHDTMEKNRDTVKTFITLPSDYEDNNNGGDNNENF